MYHAEIYMPCCVDCVGLWWSVLSVEQISQLDLLRPIHAATALIVLPCDDFICEREPL